jgi:hypothetical protein
MPAILVLISYVGSNPKSNFLPYLNLTLSRFFSIVLINTDLRPTFSELAARRTVFYLLTCGSDWRGQIKLINGVVGIDKMQIDNIIVAE